MKVLDQIREMGGEMKIFESFTGGLVAPENDDNPWHYKFTWNPRNVVLAGQSGAAKFIQEGKYKYIPPHKIFRRTEIIQIEGYGKFEGYANRDSLKYREIYGLQNIPTIYRGTLRRPGFCRAWDVFVQLGMTDDSYIMEDSEDMTFRDFVNSFLAYNPHDSVEIKLKHYLGIADDDPLFEKLEWLDLFKDIKIGIKEATPAQILQHILQRKWTLQPGEKDMVVMWNKFGFEHKGKLRQFEASMVVIGDGNEQTAMAKTVGIPVAIAAKMILNRKITTSGVHVPIDKEVYEPVLQELEQFGIKFIQKETEYKGY
jgi:saccharopine dehydrogenase-like NADP-dependent oxidoreductase